MSVAKPKKQTPYVPPTRAERRAEFVRKLDKPITTDAEAFEIAVAFDMEALHAQLDKHRSGRTGGEDRDRAALARDTAKALRAKHRYQTAIELRREAVKADPKLDKLLPNGGRWDNIVSEVAPRQRKGRKP
jgi:hypothetical protein